MADEQLRELQRLAQTEGSLEAQGELLRYRLRQGDLSPEWLATAAHLGHKAARSVLGRFVPVATYATIQRSLAADRWPKELAMRAAVGWLEPSATGRLERAALAVLAYAESPGPAELEACRALRPDARDPTSTLLDCALLPEEGSAQRLLRAILPAQRAGRGAPPEVRDLREALQPYALFGHGSPPPGLLPPDPAAWEGFGVAPAPREDLFRAFRRALKEAAVLEERDRLEAEVQAGSLAEARVRLAALLGSPAAWLLASPPGEPDLAPPARGSLVAGSLLVGLARVSGDLPKDALVREHLFRNLRHEAENPDLTEDLCLPEWWRGLYGHLSLTLARLLAGESSVDTEAAFALSATERFARGQESAEAVEAAISAAVHRARAEPEHARPGLATALRLTVRTLSSAPRPTWRLRSEHVLDLALGPGGLLPEELWGSLREAAVDWLLHPIASNQSRRPYAPSQRYAAGELLEHASFGPGEVLDATPRRIRVAFPDQTRTLAHAQGD